MQCEAYVRYCENEACHHQYYGPHSKERICPECGRERKRCGRPAIVGYRFCDYHGGPNPKNNFYGLGNAKHRMTSGVSSPFPLVRLASTYIKVREDGRVLSNRASIEVVRRRISELAERIDMNAAPDRLQNIQKLWEQYKIAPEPTVRENAANALDEEFERAYHDYASWKQMFEAIDLDRKLVESEVKVVKEIHAVLTAEDAYELTAQLLAAIIQTVNGFEEMSEQIKFDFLKRIQYEFTRIVGDRLNQPTEGSGSEDGVSESGSVD